MNIIWEVAALGEDLADLPVVADLPGQITEHDLQQGAVKERRVRHLVGEWEKFKAMGIQARVCLYLQNLTMIRDASRSKPSTLKDN